MGQPPSKLEKSQSLKSINQEVEFMRNNIRASRHSLTNVNRGEIQAKLVRKSQQVNAISHKFKQKDVQKAQKLISTTCNELLTLDNSESYVDDRNLDSAAVESNSFINLPTNKKSSKSVGVLKSLDEIQTKFRSLQEQTQAIISNQDKSQITFMLSSIKNVATDLELIPTNNNSLKKQKKDLEENLRKLYQKLSQLKKDTKRDNNLKYLTQLAEDDKSNTLLVRKIDDNLTSINLENYKTQAQLEDLKLQLTKYRNEISELNLAPEKSVETSTKIASMLDYVEKSLDNFNIYQEKLVQAELSLDKFQKDAVYKFTKSSKSEDYKNYQKYLNQLKDYVAKIPSLENRKTLFFEQVQTTLEILNEIASKNDNQHQEVVQVVLRHQKAPSVQSLANNNKTIDGFYVFWKDLEPTLTSKNQSQEEVSSIKELLKILLSEIGQKLDELDQNQQVLKVRVKIEDSPDSYKINQTTQDFQQIEIDIKSIKNRIENEIFDKSSQDYETIKTELDKYTELLQKSSSYHKSLSLLEEIDEILVLLETKTKPIFDFNNKRKSGTTESILDELMVVSTQIDEISSDIPNLEHVKKFDENLKQFQSFLNNLDMSTYSSNIKLTRDELLKKIRELIDRNQAETSSLLNCELKILQDKVGRFSGAYRNVLYNKLEENLNNLVEKAAKCNFNEIRQEAGNLLKILEQKSAKSSNYPQKSRQLLNLEKLEDKLQQIGAIVKNHSKDDLNFDLLDEELINLFVNFNSFESSDNPGENLEARKLQNLEETKKLINLVRGDSNNSRNVGIEGTFV